MSPDRADRDAKLLRCVFDEAAAQLNESAVYVLVNDFHNVKVPQ